MHTAPLLPREASDDGSNYWRRIASDENRLVLRIEGSKLDGASLHRRDALDDVALIGQTRNDQVVDTRSGVELDENHLAGAQQRSHAVAGDTQRDVTAGRNIVQDRKSTR